MLNEKLIEKALALTGKTMEDMSVKSDIGIITIHFYFEKFCYYLLSPEFIEKLCMNNALKFGILTNQEEEVIIAGKAIYEYQLGNEKPLTNLLSKI